MLNFADKHNCDLTSSSVTTPTTRDTFRSSDSKWRKSLDGTHAVKRNVPHFSKAANTSLSRTNNLPKCGLDVMGKFTEFNTGQRGRQATKVTQMICCNPRRTVSIVPSIDASTRLYSTVFAKALVQ